MKKMNKQIVSILLVLILSFFFTACKKENIAEVNEEEVITTLVVKLTPIGGGTTLQFAFDDPDGNGGAAPTYQDIVLAPSTSYAAELIVLDKTATPVDTVSNEIREEAAAHRFYFETQNNVNLTINNLDTDANGIPLGLSSIWTTAAASTGKLQITLRHYPGTPPDKATTDLVNSTKSGTDLTTTDTGGFTVKIQ
jgi:hypothetical protein